MIRKHLPYKVNKKWFVKIPILATIAFCLFSCQSLISQDIFKDPLILNSKNGLPSNIVNVVVKDSKGFAWIGTAKGLVRYDGSNTVKYTYDKNDSTSIDANYVTAIVPDLERNKIWVGHSYGLSYLNVETNKFHNFRHNSEDEFSIPDARVQDMIMDRSGEIWIAMSKGGLLKYLPEKNGFEKFEACQGIEAENSVSICQTGIMTIAEDLQNDSILYLGARGLIVINKNTGEYNYNNIIFDDLKKNNIANVPRVLLAHSNGKVYYGTTNYGVFEFDPKNKKIREIIPRLQAGITPLEIVQVRDLVEKSEDEIWITSTGGLSIYRISDNTITKNYKNIKGQSYGVSFEDEQNRLWLASAWNGLHIFNPLLCQSEVLYFESDESKHASFAIRVVEDTLRDRLYVCALSSGGLYIYHQKTEQWQLIPPPIDYEMKKRGGFQSWDVTLLDNGQVLLLEDEKLYYYQDGFQHLKPYPLQWNNKYPGYRSVLKNKKGNYWIVSEFKPFLTELNVSDQKLRSFEETIAGLSSNNLSLFGITEDVNHNIWMLELNGLVMYDDDEDSFLYHEYLDPLLKSNQTIGKHIEADEYGRVWISAKTPYLSYTSNDEIKQHKINVLGDDQGVLSSTLSSKAIGNELTIFTTEGIQFFDLEEWKFTKRIDKQYRIPSPIVNNTLLSDKRIAIGNMKRLALVPRNPQLNEEVPRAYVTAFSVFDDLRPIQNIPGDRDSIKLSYKENFFSFEFSAIAYNLPKRVRYECKLEGFDEQWYDGTVRKFKSYTNVPGGEYIFKVRATSNEGVSADPAEVYLFISTVWWKTSWFWLVALLLLGSAAYALYKWRVSEILKEARMKSEYESKLSEMEMSALRAQMNPHFIFNALNSIDYYIISNDQEKASDYLNRFSRLIRLILQNSKSTVVPLQDDLEALRLYIEIESMRFDEMFEYEFLLEDKIEAAKIEIPPMILQPYVENSIWHGLKQKKEGKGKLMIKVRRGERAIICTIEDNGIGREAAELLKSKSGSKRKSYGMKITKGRIEALNQLANTKASVQIFDLYEDDGKSAGTRVEIVIPI